jgi:hypothetical protein
MDRPQVVVALLYIDKIINTSYTYGLMLFYTRTPWDESVDLYLDPLF